MRTCSVLTLFALAFMLVAACDYSQEVHNYPAPDTSSKDVAGGDTASNPDVGPQVDTTDTAEADVVSDVATTPDTKPACIPATFYIDEDGDGYGSDESAFASCIPEGRDEELLDLREKVVLRGGDCDDHAAHVYPGVPEICDDLDNDCDGSTDEEVTQKRYEDLDHDGYGSEKVIWACPTTPGTATYKNDCNDHDANVYFGAHELCDEIDNDCDGLTDEGAKIQAYMDSDGDGFGDAEKPITVCTEKLTYEPSPFVLNIGDCNDADHTIHPGAPETCDGTDNDCDGSTDEGAVDAMAWFPDQDGDGYGDMDASSVFACNPPAPVYTDNNGDCNDFDSYVNPGSIEWCGRWEDDNCDGVIGAEQPCVEEGHYSGNITMEFEWADESQNWDCIGDDLSGNSLALSDGAGITLAGFCHVTPESNLGDGGYPVLLEGDIVWDEDAGKYLIVDGVLTLEYGKGVQDFVLDWAGVFHDEELFSGGTYPVPEVQTTLLGGKDINVRMTLNGVFLN